MEISELFPVEMLGQHLADGYVKAQAHPTKPLTILNYTNKTQYDDLWDDVTSWCRGLIVEQDWNSGLVVGSSRVVGLPFKKFHNLGFEPGQRGSDINLDVLCGAFDKLDGSLGVLFHYDGEWDIATRGSFTSDQACWARDRLYMYTTPLDPNLTYLVEIIYPENRVVVDYKGKEGLILLGAHETQTGKFFFPAQVPWFGERASLIASGTLRSILELPPRPGAEGLVLHIEKHGMWKLKQEDYVRMHRIVFGLTERAVWEHMGANDYRVTDEFYAELPDEFYDWVKSVADRLMLDLQLRTAVARTEFERLEHLEHDRKAFALEATRWVDPNTYWQRPSLLFMLLDGKDIRPAIWKDLFPAHAPARILDETTA